MYYMDGEEDLLGDDFVDQHEVEEEEEGGYTHGCECAFLFLECALKLL